MKSVLDWLKGLMWWRRAEIPPDMSAYADEWVAVKGGKVIGHDRHIRALMDELKNAPGSRGCVIFFQSKPEHVNLWAVMYREYPGRLFPNCSFKDRASAEDWLRSLGGDDTYLAFRTHQHAPWVEVTDDGLADQTVQV